MAEPRDFIEAEGLVHIIDPTNAEYTLCGDAFDAGTDIEDYEWTATKRRTVTCPRCAMIVELCRGVRTNPDKGKS